MAKSNMTSYQLYQTSLVVLFYYYLIVCKQTKLEWIVDQDIWYLKYSNAHSYFLFLPFYIFNQMSYSKDTEIEFNSHFLNIYQLSIGSNSFFQPHISDSGA